MFSSSDHREKIKITRQGDSSTTVAVSLDPSLENHYPFCPSSQAPRAEQTHWGDRIRRKMRKIIGRSDLIMATPVKNNLLIGIWAVW